MVLWELHPWLWELNLGFGNGNIVDLNEYSALGIASLALGIEFWFWERQYSRFKLNMEEMSKRGMKYVLGCDLGENSLRLHIYKCDDPQTVPRSMDFKKLLHKSNKQQGNGELVKCLMQKMQENCRSPYDLDGLAY